MNSLESGKINDSLAETYFSASLARVLQPLVQASLPFAVNITINEYAGGWGETIHVPNGTKDQYYGNLKVVETSETKTTVHVYGMGGNYTKYTLNKNNLDFEHFPSSGTHKIE